MLLVFAVVVAAVLAGLIDADEVHVTEVNEAGDFDVVDDGVVVNVLAVVAV